MGGAIRKVTMQWMMVWFTQFYSNPGSDAQRRCGQAQSLPLGHHSAVVGHVHTHVPQMSEGLVYALGAS